MSATNRQLKERGERLAEAAREARQEAASDLAAQTGGFGGERLTQETTGATWGMGSVLAARCLLLPPRSKGRRHLSAQTAAAALAVLIPANDIAAWHLNCIPLTPLMQGPMEPTPRAAVRQACWAAWVPPPRRPPPAPSPTCRPA